ncbi:MAG: GerMN domain-containing protein [Saprospiraceae bacterium]|nr:GerMN domain-containing protein [Saprospiraceae bacterium]
MDPIGDTLDRTAIYLVARGDAGASGILAACNDSLVPVQVIVPQGQTPFFAAINTLVTTTTRTYGQSGLYNALWQSALVVDDAAIVDGEAVIQLSGDVLVSGVCDDARLVQQLAQTALQFEGVNNVLIFINGIPYEPAAS